MSRLWSILRFRPVAATLIVVALVLAYQAWIAAGAARKLRADELPPADSKAAYEIVLRFAPEAFHTTRLQDLGRVIKVEGSSVFMADVPAAALRDVARNYWVVDISRWQGP